VRLADGTHQLFEHAPAHCGELGGFVVRRLIFFDEFARRDAMSFHDPLENERSFPERPKLGGKFEHHRDELIDTFLFEEGLPIRLAHCFQAPKPNHCTPLLRRPVFWLTACGVRIWLMNSVSGM